MLSSSYSKVRSVLSIIGTNDDSDTFDIPYSNYIKNVKQSFKRGHLAMSV